MDIRIVVGGYYPKIHPRAFRATELAKEFVRQGHRVTVICMSTEDGFDYDAYSLETGIKVIHYKIFSGKRTALVASQSSHSVLGRLKRFMINYFICGDLFRHSESISKVLGKLKGADMAIVLSTPFAVHYGYSKYVRKKGKPCFTVLDSGDPFYYSKQTKRAIWFKYIEKQIYKCCDYLTIPTENAIRLYSPIIPIEKIKVIPQGFDMRNLKLYSGEFSGQIKIAYAGVFYWDIRNPEFLIRYLDQCDADYVFYLYMRFPDSQLKATIKKYPNFANRVKVAYNLPHDDLLYELSKMDFLVNIENLSNTQMPSKLIDYGMTKRPIFSCKESTFSTEKMDKYLNREYVDSYIVAVDNYNIEKIAGEFIALYKASRI